MAGTFLELQIAGVAEAIAALLALDAPARQAEGLAITGGLIEMQTKHRIAAEKSAPDGTPWAPWSDDYATSRHRGHSLLVGDGHLLGSINWQDQGDQIEVGSNLVYAAIHQFGGTPDMAPGPRAIPARPYLGLSDENVVEIEAELVAWLSGVLH